MKILEMGLCGACHQWGTDPFPNADYTGCKTCERTYEEIRRQHGCTHLSHEMKARINTALAIKARINTALAIGTKSRDKIEDLKASILEEFE